MQTFTRDDGQLLRVVAGYRQRVLSNRSTYSPRADWTDDRYRQAAEKKLQRTARFVDDCMRWGGRIEEARVLDLGCGDGLNCFLLALAPARQVVGIDMELPLVEPVERHDRTRRLAAAVADLVGLQGDLDDILAELPLSFHKMDARALAFDDNSFDLLISRSAIEHIIPFERALAEMARVVRPGGLIHLSTDPYFSPRGCHKTGVVDIPWAHARMSLDEYRRFVLETEGPRKADRRCERLTTLNPYTIREWREKIESAPFEILEWHEERSPLAETLLSEYGEVVETLRPEIEHRDLVNSRLKMWLRKHVSRGGTA